MRSSPLCQGFQGLVETVRMFLPRFGAIYPGRLALVETGLESGQSCGAGSNSSSDHRLAVAVLPAWP